MTTAVGGRVRRSVADRSLRWPAAAFLVVLLAAGAVLVHVSMPSWYARMWYPIDHLPAITAEAEASGITTDLLAAVIYQESRFAEDARSERGAVGLMQVLPETARWIHRQPGAPAAAPERLAEPEVNIAYGAWYLHYLIDKYDDLNLALAAYNAGETNVLRWIVDARDEGRSLGVRDLPFSETRGFVAGVNDARSVYRRAWSEALGLS